MAYKNYIVWICYILEKVKIEKKYTVNFLNNGHPGMTKNDYYLEVSTIQR